MKHFEDRLEAMDGKAMIVCMSRRICVDLYNAIVKLRPDWHGDDDAAGSLKVVMTGSRPRTRWTGSSTSATNAAAKSSPCASKNAKDPFRMVIVRDMWLTGFDVPCLHTMYLDKYMRGHGLMQAIARVNRVFKDKPGGLVVDYLGVAQELKHALATYTESGGKGKTAVPQEDAVAALLEKYEVCCGLFHGFDWPRWTAGTPAQKLSLLPNAQEHILKQEDGKKRLTDAVKDLSSAFALAVPHPRRCASATTSGSFRPCGRSGEDDRSARAAGSGPRPRHSTDRFERGGRTEVIDIFEAAGPEEARHFDLVGRVPCRSSASCLRGIWPWSFCGSCCNDEIKTRSRRNVVQSRLFSEMLEGSFASTRTGPSRQRK